MGSARRMTVIPTTVEPRVPRRTETAYPLLYGTTKAPDHRWIWRLEQRGRYWDRTSDLFGVN